MLAELRVLVEGNMGKKKKTNGKKTNGIHLTPKGLGVKDGDLVSMRYALKHVPTGKTVYVYGLTESGAMETACRHFNTMNPEDVTLEIAGRVEWKILDRGLPNERAVHHLVWLPGHDVTELIDRQHDMLGKHKPKEKKS